jgi:hypothetical protein
VLEEQTKLRAQWEQALKARNDLLKEVGRERRLRDVEKQTWLEKRTNLETALQHMDKKEDGRKLNHKIAMAKADKLCSEVRRQLGALEKEAGQLKWQRAKHRKDIARDKDALKIENWSVKRKETQVARKQDRIAKRQQTLEGEEAVLCSKLEKVAALKQVCNCLPTFYWFACPCEDSFVSILLPLELSEADGWGSKIETDVVSTEQANE